MPFIPGAAIRRHAKKRKEGANGQNEGDESEEEPTSHVGKLTNHATKLAVQGQVLRSSAYGQVSSTVPTVKQSAGSPPPDFTKLLVTAPHLIDESSPAAQAHNIISVPAGSEVALVQGDLERGLGNDYKDYVLVKYQVKKFTRRSCC